MISWGALPRRRAPSERLVALGVVPPPGRLDLTEKEPAFLDLAKGRSGQRLLGPVIADPVLMNRDLATAAADGLDGRSPDVIVFHAGPQHRHRGVVGRVHDLHRLLQKG